MKKVLAVILLLDLACSVTACNTVAGVGQDVKATGQGVENAARDVQKKL